MAFFILATAIFILRFTLPFVSPEHRDALCMTHKRAVRTRLLVLLSVTVFCIGGALLESRLLPRPFIGISSAVCLAVWWYLLPMGLNLYRVLVAQLIGSVVASLAVGYV